jgi:hypothetical protein
MISKEDYSTYLTMLAMRWQRGNAVHVASANHARTHATKSRLGGFKHLTLSRLAQATIAAVAIFSWSGIAHSQNILSPIAPRFSPDPMVYSGKASGSVSLKAIAGANVMGDCQGLTQTKPNHVLKLMNPFGQLSIKADGLSNNISLLVKGPDGAFCQTGRSPKISGSWSLGEYQIWLGSIDGTPVDYRLSISETNH